MASFEDGVRKWVKLDDELRAVQERARELRENRNNVASGLHHYVDTHEQLRAATINISDGRLRFVQTQTPQSLTFKFLEESLNEIIPNKESVQQILTHIKNKRTMKLSSDIKRYYSDN
jgi:hypothetical protein